MQFMVKFAGIAVVALFFASCHNNVPGLPSPEEVSEYKYCKYNAKDECKCKSDYESHGIQETCEKVGGELFDNKISCDSACSAETPPPPSL